jgi:hypothetical protein
MLRFGTPENPEMYEMGVIASSMLHGHGYAMHWLTYIPQDSVRRAMIESHAPPPYETAWTPPLQTYIVYGAFRLFGETPRAASMLMILNVVWSALLPLAVYFATLALAGKSDEERKQKDNTSEAAARLSAIIATLFLPAAYAVITYTGSSLYHLVVVLFMWMLLVAVRRRNAAYLLAAGACAGVQMLLRSEFLAVGCALIPLAGGLVYWQTKRTTFIAASVLGCGISLFILSPWMLRNYAVFGQIVPIVSRPWFEIWRGNNPHATGTEWKTNGQERASVLADTTYPEYRELTREFDALPLDSTFEIRANAVLRQEALAYMRENPAQTLALAAKKAVFLWVHDLYNPQSRNVPYILSMISVSILILCGVASLWQRSSPFFEPNARWLYAAYLLMYTAIFALTFVLPRYRIYVFVGCLPLTGLGLMYLWNHKSNAKP